MVNYKKYFEDRTTEHQKKCIKFVSERKGMFVMDLYKEYTDIYGYISRISFHEIINFLQEYEIIKTEIRHTKKGKEKFILQD
jgi:hypothetical protein